MKVSAVSYLNTWPLIWGFREGPETLRHSGAYDFRFDLPAQCADALGTGDADLGLVPSAELDRLGMGFLPDLGIACDGPVRSILLISKKPFGEIRTLSADSGSRTSVALTRILLAERFGCRPEITRQSPDLHGMLADHDAALIIGDPALHIVPAALPYECLDLGSEWVAWSGLPMVFAVWAGREEVLRADVAADFAESYRWGRTHTEEIVARAAAERGYAPEVAREYITRNIVYRLDDQHRAGLELFRRLVRRI